MLSSIGVTPHVGVWIETPHEVYQSCSALVTPHVGVWIETFKNGLSWLNLQVTPHVGVWIETMPLVRTPKRDLGSHLM